jgi:serine kinase of HPr protein (carbohydrate metabolism regulator)
MTRPDHSETVHATCVAVRGRGVLLLGHSGSGKSDLALRLIDRGAMLVSDDYTIVTATSGRLLGSAPSTIAGKMEIRGVGLVEMECARDVPICLAIDLDRVPDRLPEEGETLTVAGGAVPLIGLGGLEASAPIKAEHALLSFGLAAQ